MSTFQGEIVEIKDIAVDNFEKHNYSAQAYFLSHIHSDHIHGIKDDEFHKHLAVNGYFVYTSEITRIMLKNKFPNIAPFLRTLEICRETSIRLRNGSTFSVTTLPAGHCPGSVMFLFETNDKRILYTGDIRLENNEIKHIKRLHNFLNKPIEIDSMYFDSTFFLKKYRWFPTREQSISKICELVDEWINKSDQHKIYIKLPAEFSLEYVFISIYERLKLQIYMNPIIYEDVYKYIPEMDNIVIFNKSKARIHAGYSLNNQQSNDNLLILLPSALIWENKLFVETNNEIIKKDGVVTRICYSSHCSYTELIDIITYLKPKKLIPCVKPNYDLDEFEAFIDEYNNSGTVDVLNKNAAITSVEEKPNEFNYNNDAFYEGSGVLTLRRRSSSNDSIDLFLKSCQEC